MVADGLAQFGGVVSMLAADAWHAAWHPSRAHRLLSRYASAFQDLLSPTPFAPRLSLNAAVGFDRRVLVVRERMADLRRAQEHFGVKLNDLLLTAVAAGVHDLLSARGEVMEDRQLQVLVPVGSDHHDDHRLGNEVSAMLVRLPISAAPAAERLREVAAVERSHKEHGQARATNVLFSSLNSLPPPAVSAASHLMDHQPFVNLVVTNVPGPDFPLFLLGERLLEVIPLVPLGGNLSVSVAALSYDGQFTLGVLADPDSCPDADVLAAGIERCFAQLLGAARARARRPGSLKCECLMSPTSTALAAHAGPSALTIPFGSTDCGEQPSAPLSVTLRSGRGKTAPARFRRKLSSLDIYNPLVGRADPAITARLASPRACPAQRSPQARH